MTASRVAILINKEKEGDYLPLLGEDQYSIFPVAYGQSLRTALQTLKCGVSRGTVGKIINLCCGDDGANGLSAATVANLAERGELIVCGCSQKTLTYSYDILLMMLSYGNVVLPRYYVITQVEDIAKIVPHLNVPFCFCSSSPLQYEEVVNVSEGSGREAVEAHFLKWGKTILMDVPAKVEASADMVVSCSGKVYTIQSSGGEEFVKSCEKSALCFQKSVLGTHGFARLAFYANAENEACLKSFQLNPSLTALKMSVRDLVDDLAESSVTPEVLFKIVLHEDSRKGYRVCATRHIRKGELVFEDECRSFAMVTREHVRRNWSSEDKKTFSEYAWPLDSEGHLYCIWESDPTRWRPLNHSCEPNCIFEKPHSLNVIAARDIDVSEDITMDYATFCDATMKPFQCLCGSRQCRGLIQPEEGVLESYKGHSWLRKLVNVSSIE